MVVRWVRFWSTWFVPLKYWFPKVVQVPGGFRTVRLRGSYDEIMFVINIRLRGTQLWPQKAQNKCPIQDGWIWACHAVNGKMKLVSEMYFIAWWFGPVVPWMVRGFVHTLVDEQSIQRVVQEFGRGMFSRMRDYLGGIWGGLLETFEMAVRDWEVKTMTT